MRDDIAHGEVADCKGQDGWIKKKNRITKIESHRGNAAMEFGLGSRALHVWDLQFVYFRLVFLYL